MSGYQGAERPQDIELLKDIAEALNETMDIPAAMSAILPRLSQAMGLSTAWAFRFDSARHTFNEVGASGLPPALAKDGCLALRSGWCECQDQFVSGKLKSAVNVVRCSRLRSAIGETNGLVFHASIPLRSKGQMLGVLNVAVPGQHQFSERHLALLSAVGHQVAVAVGRAELLERERRLSYMLRTLSSVSAELVSIVDLDVLLQTAVRQIVQRFGYEACGIMLLNQAIATDYLAMADQSIGYDYRSVEAPLLNEDQRLLLDEARSVVCCSIPQSDYTIRLESSMPSAFSETDDDILSSLAWHLAAALDNVRLHEQSVASAKWSERRRLAADLHDAVSQRLFSALLLARTAAMQLETESSTASIQTIIQRVESLIAESQDEMRDLIRQLKPVEERGLTSMLRERLAPLQLQGRTRFHLTADIGVDERLSYAEKDVLLKVIDEALQNVLKHAHARDAYITVTIQDSSLMVSIHDNGVGFDTTQVSYGLGLFSISDRLRKLGGEVELMSTVGNGTDIRCRLPLLVKEDGARDRSNKHQQAAHSSGRRRRPSGGS